MASSCEKGSGLRSADSSCRTALSFVLITAARNEARYIESTISSVLSQSVLPLKWVIVSDGSTDRTDDIVRDFLQRVPWMELVRMAEHPDREFGAKARCFNAGYRVVASLPFDLVANLDADVSFDADYFEYLLQKFADDPALGVAGTPMREESHDPVKDGIFNEHDVFGACQVFRRECFEQIGGYTPIKGGGIDWVAVRTARMLGWKTRSFMDKTFFHLRPMGATGSNVWMARFNYGRKDYALGNHPLWEFLRIAYQLTRKPLVAGGLLLLLGYMWALLTHEERPVSRELMMFHRREQIARLRDMLKDILRKGTENE